MSEKPWWTRGLAWVKRQYDTPISAPQSPSAAKVTYHELIPGELSAQVYDHLFTTSQGNIPCWTYVSEGLERHEQPEIVFILVHPAEATVPSEDPLRLLQMIKGLAETSHLMYAGGITLFGQRKFLGRHLAYIPAQKLPGVSIPRSAICALLVTDDEVAAVQEFGITRVMARLGQAARYYPCLPCSDPFRPGISFAETRKNSLLAGVICLSVPGCRVYQANGRVVMLLAKGSGSVVACQIRGVPAKAAFALLTEFDPEADGCLVWEPGQSEPVAITPEGSTGSQVCGCFIAFAPGQAEDGVYGLEDGFGTILTLQSWRLIQKAIEAEAQIHIPPTNGRMAFVLDWYITESEPKI